MRHGAVYIVFTREGLVPFEGSRRRTLPFMMMASDQMHSRHRFHRCLFFCARPAQALLPQGSANPAMRQSSHGLDTGDVGLCAGWICRCHRGRWGADFGARLVRHLPHRATGHVAGHQQKRFSVGHPFCPQTIQPTHRVALAQAVGGGDRDVDRLLAGRLQPDLGVARLFASIAARGVVAGAALHPGSQRLGSHPCPTLARLA